MPLLRYQVPATLPRTTASAIAYLASILSFSPAAGDTPAGKARQLAEFLGLEVPLRAPVTVVRVSPEEGPDFYRITVDLDAGPEFLAQFTTDAQKIQALSSLYLNDLQRATGGHVTAEAPDLGGP